MSHSVGGRGAKISFAVSTPRPAAKRPYASSTRASPEGGSPPAVPPKSRLARSVDRSVRGPHFRPPVTTPRFAGAGVMVVVRGHLDSERHGFAGSAGGEVLAGVAVSAQLRDPNGARRDVQPILPRGAHPPAPHVGSAHDALSRLDARPGRASRSIASGPAPARQGASHWVPAGRCFDPSSRTAEPCALPHPAPARSRRSTHARPRSGAAEAWSRRHARMHTYARRALSSIHALASCSISGP